MSDTGALSVGDRMQRFEDALKEHERADVIQFAKIMEKCDDMQKDFIKWQTKLTMLMTALFFVAVLAKDYVLGKINESHAEKTPISLAVKQGA